MVEARPTAPVHDGNCGANALRATFVGNWGEPSWESRFVWTADPDAITEKARRGEQELELIH